MTLFFDRVILVFNTGHLIDHSPDLTAVAKLIVIPKIEHNVVPADYRRIRINHTGFARTHEITRHSVG